MRIAHLADLHLGYRAYHRVTARGVNVREADVAQAFQQAIDRVIELRPDLVLVAGDVFHTVRPSNSAIADAFRRLSALSARLPGVPVVMIAGNHDSPRSADTGNILALFREIPGVTVVAEEAERVRLEQLDTSILCLPHNVLARVSENALARVSELVSAQDAEAEGAGLSDLGGGRSLAADLAALEPDASSSTNLLMLHSTVSGASAEGKLRYVSEFGGVTVADTAIRAERWDYVALGHYHIATALAPNMWYSGGIERTSTNVWAEAEGEKGFLLYDTEQRRADFHALETRAVIDLPRMSARGMSGSEVDEAIRDAIEEIPGGLAGRIVRLVVTDIPRPVVRELSHRRIREWKAEALHLHLDLRPPEVQRVVASGAPMRRQSLGEQVESYLRKQWPLSSERIDRERLVALGRYYLDQAGEEG